MVRDLAAGDGSGMCNEERSLQPYCTRDKYTLVLITKLPAAVTAVLYQPCYLPVLRVKHIAFLVSDFMKIPF